MRWRRGGEPPAERWRLEPPEGGGGGGGSRWEEPAAPPAPGNLPEGGGGHVQRRSALRRRPRGRWAESGAGCGIASVFPRFLWQAPPALKMAALSLCSGEGKERVFPGAAWGAVEGVLRPPASLTGRNWSARTASGGTFACNVFFLFVSNWFFFVCWFVCGFFFFSVCVVFWFWVFFSCCWFCFVFFSP